MLYFDSIDDAAEVFKALSTPMRLKIMEMISEDNEMSMNDLAEALGLTNSAISLHVSKLEQAGLVSIHTTAGKRGSMKIVKPIHDRLLVNLTPAKEKRKYYQDDIKIGHFTTCEVAPTCGLATSKTIIGALDDPRYFMFPERFDAGILWFGYGFEYTK